MSKVSFIRKSLAFGWEKKWQGLKLLVPYFLIYLLCSFLQSEYVLSQFPALVAVLGISLPASLISLFFTLGICLAMVKLVREGKAEIRNLFMPRLKDLLNFFLVVITIVAVIVGLVFLFINLPLLDSLRSFNLENPTSEGVIALSITALLAVAFIYLAVRIYFIAYILVDKRVGPIKSLKMSFKLTKGVFFRIIAFEILVGLICLLGLLCFVVGLIVAIPVTFVARAYVYDFLLKRAEARSRILTEKMQS